jgi:phosphatidylglycerophosphatase A
MANLIMFLATGFYSGRLPKAPGTWGSLIALPLHFLLLQLDFNAYLLALGIIFLLAVSVAGSAEKILDTKDPGCIVIDEIIGMLIALFALPATPLILVLGFILFRFFDVVKPFPVSWFDSHLNGGFGIVMDDVAAGVYAYFCLKIILMLLPVF